MKTTEVMERSVVSDDSSDRPLLARWAVAGMPTASTDMQNPDTSTYRSDTEDNDT